MVLNAACSKIVRKKEKNEANKWWRRWPLGRCFNIAEHMPTMTNNSINLTTLFEPLFWWHGGCRIGADSMMMMV
jgi:hypothetical protein